MAGGCSEPSDEENPICLACLGDDALVSVAAHLPKVDVYRLGRASKSLHASLGPILHAERAVLAERLHKRHCACSHKYTGDRASDARSCAWFAALQGHQHVSLRERQLPLVERVAGGKGCQPRNEQISEALVSVALHLISRSQGEATIQELSFDWPHGVTDEAMRMLVRSLPSVTPGLRGLSMSGCALGDAGAGALAGLVDCGCLPRLQTLELEDNAFSPAARTSLRRVCRAHRIALSAYSEVENEALSSSNDSFLTLPYRSEMKTKGAICNANGDEKS